MFLRIFMRCIPYTFGFVKRHYELQSMLLAVFNKYPEVLDQILYR